MVVIIVDVTFASYVQNFNLHLAVNNKSICTGIFGGSSVWISTQQTNMCAYTLDLIYT